MKVLEKGTDRKAEVHLLVEGSEKLQDEYGEHFDEDNAIACFVAVEEGDKLRVDGKFTGTTTAIHYDVLVDGVCRKSQFYTSKTISLHKNKRLSAQSFLVDTPEGIIDTECKVSALPANDDKDEVCGYLGTIEVRVYVLRALEDRLSVHDQMMYFDDDADEYLPPDQPEAMIPTDCYLTFEKESTPLDKNTAGRLRRKAEAYRPGKEVWAVFRFYYRSEEAILAKNLKVTFADKDKIFRKTPARELRIKSMPPMEVATLPRKPEELDGELVNEASTTNRTPSAAPSSPSLARMTTPISKVPDMLETPGTPLIGNGTNKSNKKGILKVAELESDEHSDKSDDNTAEPTERFEGIAEPVQEAGEATHEVEHTTVATGGRSTSSLSINSITSAPDPSRGSSIVRSMTAPAKRAATGPPQTSPPVTKRTKISPSPATTTAQPVSWRHRLIEARMNLEKEKATRGAIANEQSKVTEELAPFEEQMRAEAEAAEKRVAEEQAARFEEEKRLRESVSLLRQFQSHDF